MGLSAVALVDNFSMHPDRRVDYAEPLLALWMNRPLQDAPAELGLAVVTSNQQDDTTVPEQEDGETAHRVVTSNQQDHSTDDAVLELVTNNVYVPNEEDTTNNVLDLIEEDDPENPMTRFLQDAPAELGLGVVTSNQQDPIEDTTNNVLDPIEER
ncbi:hypothetical protein LINPERPRIM_LOCUS12096 [Linum perenne]